MNTSYLNMIPHKMQLGSAHKDLGKLELLNVCGRRDLHHFSEGDFSHMISIDHQNQNSEDLRLPGIQADRHLTLNFADVNCSSFPDCPSIENVSPLFNWLTANAGITRLLVHSKEGIGRSPSVALLVLCAFYPECSLQKHLDAVESAAKGLKLSPRIESSSHRLFIAPNLQVAQVGDILLNRNDEISMAVNNRYYS